MLHILQGTPDIEQQSNGSASCVADDEAEKVKTV